MTGKITRTRTLILTQNNPTKLESQCFCINKTEYVCNIYFSYLSNNKRIRCSKLTSSQTHWINDKWQHCSFMSNLCSPCKREIDNKRAFSFFVLKCLKRKTKTLSFSVFRFAISKTKNENTLVFFFVILLYQKWKTETSSFFLFWFREIENEKRKHFRFSFWILWNQKWKLKTCSFFVFHFRFFKTKNEWTQIYTDRNWLPHKCIE